MNIPERIIAGDSIGWTESLADYPASLWTLTYKLLNSAGAITISTSANGDDHVVSEDGSVTNGYTPGEYKYFAYVTENANPNNRVTVEQDTIVIAENIAIATNLETRTQAKRTLDAINAVIEGRASKDQESMSYKGRAIGRTPIEDLLKLRDRFAVTVQQEEDAENLAKGIKTNRNVKVRMP